MNANPTRKRSGRVVGIRDKWLADLTVHERRLGNSLVLYRKRE